MSDERVLQKGATLSDPTSFGHSFMPPWTVSCKGCGANSVSYSNEETDKCPKCGGEVSKADPATLHNKKKLPAHSVISADGIKEFKPDKKEESKPLSEIITGQSCGDVKRSIEPSTEQIQEMQKTLPKPKTEPEESDVEVSLSEMLSEESSKKGSTRKKNS